MNDGIIKLNKLVGQTPLQALDEFKKLNQEFLNTPLTYAGRLDPMAEGLLIALHGQQILEKEKFLYLNKTYEVTFIVGFSSDSLDILGLPQSSFTFDEISQISILETLESFKGKLSLPFPNYSSKPVNGKPLFWWAQENRLNEIEIPVQNSEIFSTRLLESLWQNWQDIFNYIQTSVAKVEGNFRQEEILKEWSKLNERISGTQKIQTIKIEIECSSGTYIRSLIHEFGERINTPTLLYKLKRTSIGKYSL